MVPTEVEAVLRAVTRLHEGARFDSDGNKAAEVAIERQDLDEMLGNLIELQFGQGRNWPLGSALSITLTAMVMLVLIVYVRATSKTGDMRHG